MKSILPILLVTLFFASCAHKQSNQPQPQASDSLIEDVAVVDSGHLEVYRNIAVIPKGIAGDNSANVIRNAVKDVDGNSYDAVRIGDQVWMQTDLRTRHFRDGSAVGYPHHEDGDINSHDYSNTESYWIEEYFIGKLCLYNWSAAANSHGLCPEGWRVPTKADWDALEACLGQNHDYVQGEDLRNVAKVLCSTQWPDWIEYEHEVAASAPVYKPASTNNAAGFSAYPWPYYDGKHYADLTQAAYWTSDVANEQEAWSVKIYGDSSDIHQEPDGKGNFFLVRCVRNVTTPACGHPF